jgi:hypothetical protein
MTSPLTIAMILFLQREADHVEQRLKQPRYCAAVEARAQHREIERVQPQSHLTPAEEAANRKVAAGRLVMPEQIKQRLQRPENRPRTRLGVA